MDENTQNQLKAIVRIHRKDQLGNSLRKFKVIIDGKIVGKIQAGDTVEFYVQPGSHEIYVKLDWSRSKKVRINLNPNQIKNLISGTINTYVTILFLIFIEFIFYSFKRQIIGIVLLSLIIISTFIPSVEVNLKAKK